MKKKQFWCIFLEHFERLGWVVDVRRALYPSYDYISMGNVPNFAF